MGNLQWDGGSSIFILRGSAGKAMRGLYDVAGGVFGKSVGKAMGSPSPLGMLLGYTSPNPPIFLQSGPQFICDTEIAPHHVINVQFDPYTTPCVQIGPQHVKSRKSVPKLPKISYATPNP